MNDYQIQGGAMALQQVRPRFQITIPASLRKILNIKVGDLIEIDLQGDDALVIKPKSIIKKRKTKEAKEQIAKILKSVRERSKDLDQKEVERIIDEARAEVRA